MVKVLITGASSYLGARLFVDLKKDFVVTGTFHNNKIFSDLVEMDITVSEQVFSVVESVKPDVIVHAAANPFASWCEQNPVLAKKINEDGTKIIVNAANKVNAKIIFISSFAAIKPNNVYGKTKLAGEKLVKKTKAGFVILRPSLIIGFSPNTVNDRPFNRLLKNIVEKTPAVYDTSWKFQPTYIGQISEIIKIIINKGINKETIPISVPEQKNRFEIAKDILPAFGINPVPKDAQDKTPVITQTQGKLKKLKLPQYNYAEIIEKIIKETKEHLGKEK